MKVAHVLNRIDNNGITKAVINLCNELKDKGIDSEIIVSSHSLVQVPAGITLSCIASSSILQVNSKTRWLRRLAKYSLGGLIFYKFKAKSSSQKLQELLKEKDIDVVFLHCHYSKVMYSELNIKNCYMVLHNKKSLQLKAKWWLPSKINMWVMANAIKDKPKLAVSKSVKNDLRRRLKVKDSMIQVIPNIVDANEIRQKAGEQLLPAALGLEPNNYLVAVGRLDKQKRFDRLLRAYAAANVEQKLVIAGEGKLKGYLERVAINNHIQHKVMFVGHIDNPYPLIQQAKALVLTSDYEGLPTVLIEALLLNTAVLATACSGVREAVAGAKGAFIVPIRDEQRLAKGIQYICNMPKLAINAKEVEDTFAKQSVAQQYLELVINAKAG